MAEILAAKLCADAEILRQLVNLRFHRQIAERMRIRAALRGKRVEIARRCQLHRLHRLLGAGPADDDGEMVRWARGGAQGEDFLLEESDHAVVREDRRRRLIEEALVGRTAALGDEQELVGILAFGGDFDLRGKVVAGVLFFKHRERGDLTVAQVFDAIGVADALRDRRLVVAFGPHKPALLGVDDGGAGVLTHRQHAARRDVGVLQQVVSDEAIVGGRLGVVDDFRQLREMAGAQEMVDVDHRLFRKQPDRFGFDDQNFAPQRLLDAHALVGEFAPRRRIDAELEEWAIGVGHATVRWGC